MTGLLQRHFFYCFSSVALCNGLDIAESERNGHCTFKDFDSCGVRSDENINSGVLLSFDVVCVGSPAIIMLQKSKQTSLRNFKFD